MRVLSVAYPFTEAGTDAVGGSEQILAILDRALVEGGHESIVIAARGSCVKGTLVASRGPNGTLDEEQRNQGQREHARLIRQVLEAGPVDLVHMHSLDFHTYVPPGNVPVLGTLHLPPNWYPRELFSRDRPGLYLNCVSMHEHNSCPESKLLVPSISNGVELEHFDWRAAKRDYALALGRICPEKGFHFALDAARRARVELLLAGKVFPYASHVEYFRNEIVPRLDPQRRFLGPVGLDRKRALLAHAACLLVTSTVAETSSLVAMEALASGTPVIAFPSGALPEIVDHGKTGFLVSSAGEMADAIGAAKALRAEDCRAAARDRFSANLMVRRYFELYERIVDEPRRSGAKPALQTGSSPAPFTAEHT